MGAPEQRPADEARIAAATIEKVLYAILFVTSCLVLGPLILIMFENSPDHGTCPLRKYMDADLAGVTKHCEIDHASNQQCALDAASSGTPFRMQRDLWGIDSQIRVGFGIPKAGGPIYEYWYDSDPSGGWNRHPRVSRSSCASLRLRPGCKLAEELCLECEGAFDHRVLCEVPLPGRR